MALQDDALLQLAQVRGVELAVVVQLGDLDVGHMRGGLLGQLPLDPETRKGGDEGAPIIVRNYAGADSASRFNPFQLKRWDEMFLTTDRKAVEAFAPGHLNND